MEKLGQPWNIMEIKMSDLDKDTLKKQIMGLKNRTKIKKRTKKGKRKKINKKK